LLLIDAQAPGRFLQCRRLVDILQAPRNALEPEAHWRFVLKRRRQVAELVDYLFRNVFLAKGIHLVERKLQWFKFGKPRQLNIRGPQPADQGRNDVQWRSERLPP